MNRRDFLRLGSVGTAGVFVSACLSNGAQTTPSLGPATPTATLGGPAPTPTVRGDAPPGTLLSNENVPGFYVRFYKTFRSPDPGRWQLTIKGLVDAPTTLTLDLIQRNLPLVEQNTRLKCVECWSSRAIWGGFTYAALADLVKPQAGATHIYFTCEDGYYEALPISELRKERALFVTHMDGRPIGMKYGAPLRMIIPWLYGYKGAKTVNSLEFRAQGGRGYWSDAGPYTVEGNILAGSDTPLDLGGGARPIKGGEITDH
jgi:sulfoxide reductase catalytic subunit YedY